MATSYRRRPKASMRRRRIRARRCGRKSCAGSLRVASVQRHNLHRQAYERSERVVAAADRFAREFEAGDTTGEGCKQHFGLEPRDHHADACVDAIAEGDVTQTAALQLKAVRIIPPARIAIG